MESRITCFIDSSCLRKFKDGYPGLAQFHQSLCSRVQPIRDLRNRQTHVRKNEPNFDIGVIELER
jgi:hypothetical protein